VDDDHRLREYYGIQTADTSNEIVLRSE